MNLQESIRRILKEETLKTKLINDIKNDGWFNVSPYVGGDDNLKKVTDIHSALGFMKLFLDLKGVVSEQEPQITLYKNENGENVFLIMNSWDNYIVYVNYTLIYRPLNLFLETNTNMEKVEFLQLWFKDKYNIMDNDLMIDIFSKNDFYMWGLN